MGVSGLPIAKPSTCTNNLPLNVNVLSLRQNSRARFISRYLKLAYLRFGTYELRFFTRYVDDILVALKNENTANSFKLYLETLHPNIRFKIDVIDISGKEPEFICSKSQTKCVMMCYQRIESTVKKYIGKNGGQ